MSDTVSSVLSYLKENKGEEKNIFVVIGNIENSIEILDLIIKQSTTDIHGLVPIRDTLQYICTELKGKVTI